MEGLQRPCLPSPHGEAPTVVSTQAARSRNIDRPDNTGLDGANMQQNEALESARRLWFDVSVNVTKDGELTASTLNLTPPAPADAPQEPSQRHHAFLKLANAAHMEQLFRKCYS